MRSLFSKKKEQEPDPEGDGAMSAESKPLGTTSVPDLLRQTSSELNQVGVGYAMASIVAQDQQEVIALLNASLRLEKISRQFAVSADLLASNRIDEESD